MKRLRDESILESALGELEGKGVTRQAMIGLHALRAPRLIKA
jgi:hypothetical protein